MTGLNKLSRLLLVGGLISLSTACNDNNSPKNPITLEPELVSPSGRIFDGNLIGAKVFYDCNNNMVHDIDEINTISKAGGLFEFKDVLKSIDDTCPLVGDITEETKLEGSETTITKPYKMSAPVGCKYINGFTGMAEYFGRQGVKNPFEKVKRKMKIDVEPCSYFIENLRKADASDIDKANALRASRVNSITAIITSENYNTMKTMMESGEISQVSAFMANNERLLQAAPQLLSALDNFEEQIATDSSESEPQNIGGYNPNSLNPFANFLKTLTLAKMPAAPEMLTEEMQLINLKMNAQQADFAERYLNANSRLNGMTHFKDENSTDNFSLEYESDDVTVSASSLRPSSVKFEIKKWDNGNFVTGDHRYSNTLVLTVDGWKAPSNTFTFDRNSISRLAQRSNQLVLTNSELSELRLVLEARQYDVEGRSVQALLDLHSGVEVWDKITPEDINFPAQSTAFDATIRGSNKYYWIYDNGDENCAAEHELNSICNKLEVLVPSEIGLNSSVGKWSFALDKSSSLVSLDFLINSTIPYMPVLTSNDDGYVVAYFEANGLVSYIEFPLNLNQVFYRSITSLEFERELVASKLPKVIATGTWTRAATNSNFLEFTVPQAVQRLDNNIHSNMFFTVHSGQVRFGEITSINEVLEEDVLGLGTIARDTVLNNMNFNELTNIINRRNN